MKKLITIILILISITMTGLYGCVRGSVGGDNLFPENTLPPVADPSPDIPQPPIDPSLPIPPTPTPPTPTPPTPTPPDPIPPTPTPPTPPIPIPPTPPLVVVPAGDVFVRANTDGLNIRSGRGTGYAAVGTMDSGDMLEYVSHKNGWYEVVYKRKTAYVASSLSSLVGIKKGNAAVERVIAQGKKLLGLPYVYGAERYHWGNGSLNTKYTGKSYDCSSLVQYIFKIGANVNLATTSRTQSLQGKAVTRTGLRRGDLMFFTNETRFNNSGIERIGHVGIYLGDNYILHTASDYAVIEKISSQRWSFLINSRRHL